MTKTFKISFEFETDDFTDEQGVENGFKYLFPEWKNIKVEEKEND